MKTIWEMLTIEPTTDTSIIKKAYRKALPNYHPETDPDGFKALREAYEAALNYQEIDTTATDHEGQSNSNAENVPEAIKALYDLLNNPEQRFNLKSWSQWIEEEINELSLDDFEGVQFWTLQTLLNEQNYLSHDCARLAIQRFHWQEYYEQHEDEHSKRVVLSFIQECQHNNLFDYQLLTGYSLLIQNKVIDFYQSCNERSRSSALHYLNHSLDLHHALPMPDDPKLIIKIAHWYMLIDEPNAFWLEELIQLKTHIQDETILKDIDYLINFHSMVEANHYIQLLADLNPHFHLSIAFQAYLNNTNLFPFIHIAHFFKFHVVRNLKQYQRLSFNPVVPISLPLSFISQTALRNDVIAMIEDYWGNYAFDFIPCSFEAQPKDPINALLYAVWIIKYGDEWSLEAFINAHYDYDDPIANALLKTLQESAQELLSYFQNSQVITQMKAILLIYNASRDNISLDHDDWTQKDRTLVYSWLDRVHPFTSNHHNLFKLQDSDQPNLSPLIREYSTYCFALSESHLDYIPAKQDKIDIWRQQNLLLFLFTRIKNLDYLNQYRKLINTLPKTQIKWFDQAFKILKTITNNKQCHTVDFFWEEIIEDKLKKQPQYANVFYIYHFNWRYIAHQQPQKKVLEFFYIYLMTNITDHTEQIMSDADVLLATSMLMSHHLSDDRKISLRNYLARFQSQSSALEETLSYYQQISETGKIPKVCAEWVPPFTDLLLVQNKIIKQQPFTKYDLANLNHIAYVAEDYHNSLAMAAVVLHEESPLTLWGKITRPIKLIYRTISRSQYSHMIFIAICIAIANLLRFIFK